MQSGGVKRIGCNKEKINLSPENNDYYKDIAVYVYHLAALFPKWYYPVG
jgi:hypothetical protein